MHILINAQAKEQDVWMRARDQRASRGRPEDASARCKEIESGTRTSIDVQADAYEAE